MNSLSSNKRPSACVIKLVEAVGILLGVQPSTEKSKFKAPTPSNYDQTITLLEENYADYLTEISKMRSDLVGNKVANELFAKILEPGFDYEQSVNDGGLFARDLFNAVQLVMMSLTADKSRIPIVQANVLVAVNGSMASYAAFDAATHIFKHGVVTAMALTVDETRDRRLAGMMKTHLHQDLVRRMKLQYKVPDHCFQVESVHLSGASEIQSALLESIDLNKANIVVYGMEEDRFFGEGGDQGVPRWLATSPDVRVHVMLTKKSSRTRPFSSVSIPRTYIIYFDDLRDTSITATFLTALLFLRPGDSVLAVAIVESPQPVGDGRVQRYEMGCRSGLWVNGLAPGAGEPTMPGWNVADNERIQRDIERLLISAQVEGKCVLITNQHGGTRGQYLAALATEGQADFIVLRRRVHPEVLVDVVQAAPCSVLLLA